MVSHLERLYYIDSNIFYTRWDESGRFTPICKIGPRRFYLPSGQANKFLICPHLITLFKKTSFSCKGKHIYGHKPRHRHSPGRLTRHYLKWCQDIGIKWPLSPSAKALCFDTEEPSNCTVCKVSRHIILSCPQTENNKECQMSSVNTIIGSQCRTDL